MTKVVSTNCVIGIAKFF